VVTRLELGRRSSAQRRSAAAELLESSGEKIQRRRLQMSPECLVLISRLSQLARLERTTIIASC
jgi:hypothetical protein